jgi:hypothetical protein
MSLYLRPLERTKMVTRLPTVFLATILGAIVFRWAKDLWNARAGLLALTVLVFDPTLLAHGRLATTDVGTAALGAAALYAVWRWRKRPSWRWALGAGVLLGLTMLCKTSGIFWVVAAGLMMVGRAVRGRREGKAVRYLVQSAAVGGLCLFVLWAGYGFTWGLVPGLPVSVPAPSYWKSMLYIGQYRNEVFALGLRKRGGWWWYFVLAFAIKNPLPLLIGCAIGLVTLFRRATLRGDLLVLGVFPLLYAGTAIVSAMNIGYRHMLPIHPFLYLAIGGGLEQWGWGRQGRHVQRRVLAALGVWYALMTIRMYPYELSYFNELVGGPEGGYRYLADSNVAWGQSTQALNAYLQAHPEVQGQPPEHKLRPAPGRYAVNASHLQGLGIGDPGAYGWFRHWEPQGMLYASVLLYDVPPFAIDWVAQCGVPGAPLDEAALANGTGRDDLRSLEFDCSSAWIVPAAATEGGLYVLPAGLVKKQRLCLPSLLPCPAVPDDPFVARHLAQARHSFDGEGEGGAPAYALYEMSSGTASVRYPAGSAVYASLEGMSPVMLDLQERLSGQVSLDGPLAFMGAVAHRVKEGLDVETWWQVTDGPVARPFSILAHRVSLDGQTLDASDGLGISPLAIVPGDVLVQRHRLAIPPEETVIWLRTGGYWLDTVARWPLTDVPGADALLVRLQVID